MNRRYPSRQRQPKEILRRGPEKLANIIADLMTERGYARQLAASQFQEAWNSIVEGILAEGSRPGSVRKGVLEVTVRNSMVLQELSFQKKKIIRNLNKKLQQNIIDLRFRIGTID